MTGSYLRRLGAVALVVSGTISVAGADTLVITPDNDPVPAGAVVTLRISPKVSAAGDSVTFVFGDGDDATLAYDVSCQIFGGCDTVQHTYAGPGVFAIVATGTIGGHDVTGSLSLTVTASSDESELFVATGAHGTGFNQTVWRTDLEVHNYGTTQAQYAVIMLPRGQDNTNAPRIDYTLNSGRAVAYGDILHDQFGFDGQAALRIIPIVGSIMVTSRTYNLSTAGTYGQYVPATQRSQALSYGEEGRIIGLWHEPSLQTGFRTNLGLLNVSPGPITIEVRFYQANGVLLGTKEFDLAAFEYAQSDKAFELVTQDPVDGGYIAVRTTTPGAKFLAFGSLVDNVTGDPMFIPALAAD
ncbi:MAG: hypothetical protein ACM3O7_11345 [Acidobacteriota bacterium]